MEDSPAVLKTYDLMVWLLNMLTKFPKDQRFRLAARIETTAFSFHEMVLQAVRSSNPRPILQRADFELEKLRIYLRLAQDIRCLSFPQYEYASRKVNEIGKILGGWLKKIPASTAGTIPAECGEGQAAGRLLEQ